MNPAPLTLEQSIQILDKVLQPPDPRAAPLTRADWVNADAALRALIGTIQQQAEQLAEAAAAKPAPAARSRRSKQPAKPEA